MSGFYERNLWSNCLIKMRNSYIYHCLFVYLRSTVLHHRRARGAPGFLLPASLDSRQRRVTLYWSTTLHLDPHKQVSMDNNNMMSFILRLTVAQLVHSTAWYFIYVLILHHKWISITHILYGWPDLNLLSELHHLCAGQGPPSCTTANTEIGCGPS